MSNEGIIRKPSSEQTDCHLWNTISVSRIPEKRHLTDIKPLLG